MLRLHDRASQYGVLPGDILGLERGSWQAFFIMEAAAMAGDYHRASLTQRLGGSVQPVVVVR